MRNAGIPVRLSAPLLTGLSPAKSSFLDHAEPGSPWFLYASGTVSLHWGNNREPLHWQAGYGLGEGRWGQLGPCAPRFQVSGMRSAAQQMWVR